MLGPFVARHATTARTLDLGANDAPYADRFPNSVRGDLRRSDGIDVQLDAHRLPFADGSFEVVLCTEMLEHCREPQRVLDECWRVLVPGGKLVLTTRFLFPIHEAPDDYFRFTRYGLQALCERFASVEIEEEVGTMGALGVLVQRLYYQSDARFGRGLLVWNALARALLHADGLLLRQYGQGSRTSLERAIMTSGYYVVAYRPPAEAARASHSR